MKKNYVKSSVRVREIDMESLLAASDTGGHTISSGSTTSGLVGGTIPGVGVNNDGTQPVGARKNLWSEEEEQ